MPFDDELPGIGKDLAADLLDGTLRNVAKARAVLERQMGRRLAKLRDMDGLIRLGFVRLGDYAAERLEMGCRSAQEMARVAARSCPPWTSRTIPGVRKRGPLKAAGG